MSDNVPTDLEAFVRMAREFPVRTGIFTFGLPLFALLQVVNGVLHDGSVLYIVVFALVAVGYSVQLTRYHLAVYRREKLTRRTAEGW
jgi:hypothetical protein